MKFRRISVNPSRIPRRVIALDEMCVKVNGLVGFMLDVNRNEIYRSLSSKYSYHNNS
jgi:hypothetical protein